MTGRKRLGRVLIILGALMLCAAFVLLMHNLREGKRAEAYSGVVMKQLAIRVREQAKQDRPAPDTNEAARHRVTMPVIEIDGQEYIGFLTVPDLSIELPVMKDWDYGKLILAPCRYSGTPYTGDLVIAAHNYGRHFGQLSHLERGARILFTGADGNVSRFAVEEIEVLKPTDIEEMVSGEYALTLFTCTYSGRARLAVRCVPDENESFLYEE